MLDKELDINKLWNKTINGLSWTSEFSQRMGLWKTKEPNAYAANISETLELVCDYA